MPLYLILGDSTDCDREVCSIVSGEEEDLKFLDAGDGETAQQHRAHEPEIQKASQVAIEGIKEPTALINRLAAVRVIIMINDVFRNTNDTVSLQNTNGVNNYFQILGRISRQYE